MAYYKFMAFRLFLKVKNNFFWIKSLKSINQVKSLLDKKFIDN